MLTALALTPGVSVSTGRLVDVLWGEEMPARAVPILRTYAWRLRKLLADGRPQEVLVSAGDGYLLAVGPAAVDASHAEALARQARGELAAGEIRAARRTLSEALGLWSGEALAGVPGLFAERHRDRLTELHVGLAEQYLEIEIQLGNYAEAQTGLAKVIAENPLRENLYGLLMGALYGQGRQVDALRVFQDARRLLVDEHGLEPGPELTGLHNRILRGDGEAVPFSRAPAPAPVASRPMSSPSAGRRWPAPAQLPPDLPDFTGRAAQTAILEEVLAAPARSGPALVAVNGMSGVGKTSLAVHVAHRVRHNYPDGQLYVELGASGESPLGQLLAALGDQVPIDLAERRGLFRSLMDGRRMLIVLDNVVRAAQIRDALPGTPGCGVVVTSRVRLDGLPLSTQLTLPLFDRAEAAELLRRHIGTERLATEYAAAQSLIADCGQLPLAVRIVASRLAARPQWTLRSMADRLRDRRRRIAELRAGSLALVEVFEGAYTQLTKDQADDFVLLAAVAGTDCTLDEAAAVLDLDLTEAEARLECLVDLAMLSERAPGLYSYHELLHAYALGLDRDPAREAAARRRLLDTPAADGRSSVN